MLAGRLVDENLERAAGLVGDGGKDVVTVEELVETVTSLVESL